MALTYVERISDGFRPIFNFRIFSFSGFFENPVKILRYDPPTLPKASQTIPNFFDFFDFFDFFQVQILGLAGPGSLVLGRPNISRVIDISNARRNHNLQGRYYYQGGRRGRRLFHRGGGRGIADRLDSQKPWP